MPYVFSFLASLNIEKNIQGRTRIIKDSIGYIDASKLKGVNFDSVYNKLKDTKKLIIDLRKYPGTFMPYQYADWLKKDKSPFVKMSYYSENFPGYFLLQPPKVNGGKLWRWNETRKEPYSGKIIIIVNGGTISQGEFTAMAFRSIPNSIIIGNQTAGADGDVVQVPLPGDIITLISSIGIYNPDGSETQRVGVKIDSLVYPTIKGIKNGEDELLNKAIEIAISKW